MQTGAVKPNSLDAGHGKNRLMAEQRNDKILHCRWARGQCAIVEVQPYRRCALLGFSLCAWKEPVHYQVVLPVLHFGKERKKVEEGQQ